MERATPVAPNSPQHWIAAFKQPKALLTTPFRPNAQPTSAEHRKL